MFIRVNGGTYIHSYGNSNTYMGGGAGNFTLTGQYNTGIGSAAMGNLSSGNSNRFRGSSSSESTYYRQIKIAG